MKRNFWLFAGGMILLSILGCGTKVLVLPEINLEEYERIGIIDFSSNIKGNASEFVTQKFLGEIRYSQQGTRVRRLGIADKILESVQEVEFGPETIREVGKKYKVNAIFMGDLSISEVKPEIEAFRTAIIPPGRALRIKTEVELTMIARLFETGNGAIIWTDSAQGTTKVANVQRLKKVETKMRELPAGADTFERVNLEETYGELIRSLLKKLTADFKISYKRVLGGGNPPIERGP